MNEPRRARPRRQAGYSLPELSTVVAIIGVLALVTVPAFINYYESNKIKSAMRTFTSDLRGARSLAIGHGHEVKISFNVGVNQRSYDIYEAPYAIGIIPNASWTPITGPASNPYQATKVLDNIVYFPADATASPQNFTDIDPTPDGLLDIVFFPDGHAQIPAGLASATVSIMTDRKVPKPIYQIQISPSGRVLAQ